jgi:DNA-binding MarR family transcriptional regulator
MIKSSSSWPRSSGLVKSRGVGIRVAETAHAFRVCVDEALRDHGISASQFALLDRLHAVGRPLSGRELADLIAVRPQSVAEMLGPLVRLGLIARTPHSRHGRIIESSVTAKGVALLEECGKLVQAVERRMISCLARDEISHLNDALARMATALRDSPWAKGTGVISR